MADTAALVVALSAQLTKFEKDMKGAVNVADKRTKEIENSFAKMNTAIAGQLSNLTAGLGGRFSGVATSLGRLGPIGAAAATAVVALGAAFVKAAKGVEEYIQLAGKLKDASETTGLTITQLDELSKVALEVGVSSEQLETGVSRMTIALDGVREASGPLYEKLRKVPAVLQALTNAKDTGAALDILTQHLQTLGDVAERNAFLRAIFGRNIAIGRVFQELAGRGGLGGVVDASKKAGTALDENMVSKVDELQDKIALANKEISRMVGEAVAGPFLQWTLDLLLNFKGITAAAIEAANKMKEARSAPAAPPQPEPGAPRPPPAPSGLRRRREEEPFGPPVRPAIPIEPAPAAPLIPRSVTVQPQVTTVLPPTPPTLAQRIKDAEDLLKAMGDVNKSQNEYNLLQLKLQETLKVIELGEEDLARVRKSQDLDKQIKDQQRLIEAKGENADATDRLKLANLQAQKAVVDGTSTQQQAIDKLKSLTEEEKIAILTARERAGVATEAEMWQRRELEYYRDIKQLKLDDVASIQLLINKEKEHKAAVEELRISQSKLPGVMRAGIDAADQWKQIDQVITSIGSQFENTFADIAVGTKTLKDAFKDLTDSIIRDLIRMTLRLAITGPLFQALGGAFGAGGLFGQQPFTGGLGRQHGGPVKAGSPYIVGEQGPELFVPKGAGTIVPNQLTPGRGIGGAIVEINNYVAADTETRQSTQGGPDGERIVVDIVKKAQARGEFDPVQRGRFGLRPQKVR